VDEFRFLADRDVFDFEYWELELLKLKKKQPELAGKIALVTGAASGIGKAIADRLAAAGAHVVLTDMDKRVADVAEELNSRHDGRTCGMVMDVTDEKSVVEAFGRAVLNYGGLDIFASNAGYLAADSAEDIFSLSGAEIRKYFDVNTVGPMLATREAAKIMREQGLGGSIIYNASKAGYLAGRGLSSYGSSKAAEINFARAAAQELGPLGVRVNYVNADMVDTPMFRNLLKKRAKDGGVAEGEQLQKYLARKVLAGEGFIPPEYVAEAFLYFASDRSKFTTGCVLTVDRGLPEAFPR
jgi:NAD(P)-dependent dehydrogenase (short-subunit alcohol dehydrogenase family)